MNTSDFQRWLHEHDSYFPGLDKWVGAQKDRTMEIWQETLGHIPYAAAIAASKAMYEDPDLRPKGWGDHCVSVRRLAMQLLVKTVEPPRERFVAGERVYTCADCRDSTQRVVVHPKTMLAIKEGRFRVYGNGPGTPLVTCAVWCGCEYSRSVFDVQMTPEKHKRGVEFVAYDPRRMVLAEGKVVEAITAAFAWFELTPPDLTPPARGVQHAKKELQTAPTAGDLARLGRVAEELRDSGRPAPDESEAPADEPWHPGMDIAF